MPPFLAHVVCNVMGIPPLDWALHVFPDRKKCASSLLLSSAHPCSASDRTHPPHPFLSVHPGLRPPRPRPQLSSAHTCPASPRFRTASGAGPPRHCFSAQAPKESSGLMPPECERLGWVWRRGRGAGKRASRRCLEQLRSFPSAFSPCSRGARDLQGGRSAATDEAGLRELLKRVSSKPARTAFFSRKDRRLHRFKNLNREFFCRYGSWSCAAVIFPPAPGGGGEESALAERGQDSEAACRFDPAEVPGWRAALRHADWVDAQVLGVRVRGLSRRAGRRSVGSCALRMVDGDEDDKSTCVRRAECLLGAGCECVRLNAPTTSQYLRPSLHSKEGRTHLDMRRTVKRIQAHDLVCDLLRRLRGTSSLARGLPRLDVSSRTSRWSEGRVMHEGLREDAG